MSRLKTFFAAKRGPSMGLLKSTFNIWLRQCNKKMPMEGYFATRNFCYSKDTRIIIGNNAIKKGPYIYKNYVDKELNGQSD